MRGSSFFCLIVLTIGTLRAGAGDDEKGKRLPAGAWGGQGIRMEVSEAGASIDYDCAHGSIDQPISFDPAGHFEGKGLHFREHGGPVREGAESKGEPARYIGQIDGETMTLTVRFANRDETIGTFTLGRGNPGRIRKCL